MLDPFVRWKGGLNDLMCVRMNVGGVGLGRDTGWSLCAGDHHGARPAQTDERWSTAAGGSHTVGFAKSPVAV